MVSIRIIIHKSIIKFFIKNFRVNHLEKKELSDNL